MDEQLTFHELRRLEAERKLRVLPSALLETAWVSDAQIEAVIDAVLVVALGSDLKAYSHARNVGEWCARIADALPCGPEPALARRVGVLRDVDPSALERIVELKHLAEYVREYQSYAITEAKDVRTATLIVAIADEFDARISCDQNGRAPSPRSILQILLASANDATKPVIESLAQQFHFRDKRVA